LSLPNIGYGGGQLLVKEGISSISPWASDIVEV